MRGAGAPFFRQLAEGVDVAEVISTVGVHDYRRFERRRIVGVPEKELFAIALEGNFDEL